MADHHQHHHRHHPHTEDQATLDVETNATPSKRNSRLRRSARRSRTPLIDENTPELIRQRLSATLGKLESSGQLKNLGQNLELLLEATIPSPPRTSSTTPRKSGRKRLRDDGRGPDREDGASKRDLDPDDPYEQPPKRIRTCTTFIQPPIDILALNPRWLRIDYTPHPAHDRSDTFYTEAFRRLFRRLENMVDTYFCVHDLELTDSINPWAEIDFSAEFINFAELVAIPDPRMGDWNQFLLDTTHRKWFLVGIIMRILMVRIFNADLLGAPLEAKQTLMSEERMMIGSEGFRRTLLRSQTCRQILAENPVTENFYTEIARLTAQIAYLLQPLTTYLYACPPPAGKVLPKLQDFYQTLHNIVSAAGYLSIGIRLSPTIFYMNAIKPNDQYDPDDQHSLEQEIYDESKQELMDQYNFIHGPREQQIQTALAEVNRHPALNSEGGLNSARTAALDRLNNLRVNAPAAPGYTHRPLCKIAVWPVIMRYKPGGADDEDKPLHDKDGFRIYAISKSAVVCYFGESEQARERREAASGTEHSPAAYYNVQRESLRHFIGARKSKPSSSLVQRMGLTTMVAVVAAASYFYAAPQRGEAALNMLGNMVHYAGSYVNSFELGTLAELGF